MNQDKNISKKAKKIIKKIYWSLLQWCYNPKSENICVYGDDFMLIFILNISLAFYKHDK